MEQIEVTIDRDQQNEYAEEGVDVPLVVSILRRYGKWWKNLLLGSGVTYLMRTAPLKIKLNRFYSS